MVNLIYAFKLNFAIQIILFKNKTEGTDKNVLTLYESKFPMLGNLLYENFYSDSSRFRLVLLVRVSIPLSILLFSI